jgi:molecular chaperone DnaK
LFIPVKGLEKSKKLPATGIIDSLKTRTMIRPGNSQDIIRIPIYQGDYNAEGSLPELNNFINEIMISGESFPGILPEGSNVDITIKVDSSQIMKFTAFFPLLNHTEELEIEIKPTVPPKAEDLKNKIDSAISNVKKLKNQVVLSNLIELEEQLNNDSGSADGKMKIQDSLRNELLLIDNLEKESEWPRVEHELKNAFFELEDLVKKIKESIEDNDVDLSKSDKFISEFKNSIEKIIFEKNIRHAKELTEKIDSFESELRNQVTEGSVDVSRLKYNDNNFDKLNWKDKAKARILINQGLQLITDSRNLELRPLLQEIWKLRIDKEDTEFKDILE